MNLEHILTNFGYLGIFLIVFAESGILLGFFLPGDSLLFTAGFLASRGVFNIAILCLVIFLGAVIGDSVGYAFGRRVGKRIFNREDSVLFHKDNLEKAEKFYEKYGKLTIILARFIPVIRTFAPVVAGVGKMQYSIFIIYNLIGGFIWSVGVTLAGFYLGKLIPDVDKYLLPIILIIIILSVGPSAWHLLKEKQNRKEIWDQLKKVFRR